MTLASGGVLTELVADSETLLLPAGRADLEEGLGRLRVSRLLDGFRGAAAAGRTVVVEALFRLASHLCREGNDIVEVEINPLYVTVRGRDAVVVVASDQFDTLQAQAARRSLRDLPVNSPLRNLEFGEEAVESPIREINL